MALVRVNYTALSEVAAHLAPLAQSLAAVRDDVRSTEAVEAHIGDASAAAESRHLLDQLSGLIGATAEITTSLTRALATASDDYGRADAHVVRFRT